MQWLRRDIIRSIRLWVILCREIPPYITSHKNARSMIMKVERDELVEELLKEYIKNKSWKNS